jgi:hypothetical protein
MPKQLTAEQLKALQDYAAEHGRTWKSQLNDDWMNGCVTGELQRIRNAFGPTWLLRFKFPKSS